MNKMGVLCRMDGGALQWPVNVCVSLFKKEEEKEDPQHEDIKKMMTSLFLKLDALCNFHYTPKQVHLYYISHLCS